MNNTNIITVEAGQVITEQRVCDWKASSVDDNTLWEAAKTEDAAIGLW